MGKKKHYGELCLKLKKGKCSCYDVSQGWYQSEGIDVTYQIRLEWDVAYHKDDMPLFQTLIDHIRVQLSGFGGKIEEYNKEKQITFTNCVISEEKLPDIYRPWLEKKMEEANVKKPEDLTPEDLQGVDLHAIKKENVFGGPKQWDDE